MLSRNANTIKPMATEDTPTRKSTNVNRLRRSGCMISTLPQAGLGRCLFTAILALNPLPQAALLQPGRDNEPAHDDRCQRISGPDEHAVALHVKEVIQTVEPKH